MAEVVIVPSPLTMTNGIFYNHKGTGEWRVKPNRSHVMIDNIAHPVIEMGSPSLEGYFCHDPLIDYLKWYDMQFDSSLHVKITESVLREKFWKKSELIRWIKDTLQETVLIQEYTKESYILFSTLEDDHHQLWKFLSEKTREYSFTIERSMGTITESSASVSKWLEENVSSLYEVIDKGSRFMISIRDREEAMWCLLQLTGNEYSIKEVF